MTFDKPMIDIVMEIRRRAPANDKPGIKLANPYLLDELVKVYRSSRDAVLKALTRELMNMIGDSWPERLSDTRTEERSGYVTRVYRGNAHMAEAKQPEKTSKEMETTARVKQRIYRGQVVV